MTTIGLYLRWVGVLFRWLQLSVATEKLNMVSLSVITEGAPEKGWRYV